MCINYLEVGTSRMIHTHTAALEASSKASAFASESIPLVALVMTAGGGPLLVTVMHLLARLSEAALFRERFAQFVHPELLGSLLEYLPHTHPSPHVSVTGIRHRMSASHESVRMAACVCLCVSVLECCDNSTIAPYYHNDMPVQKEKCPHTTVQSVV